MQNLNNPRWLFVINTLPITILLFLLFSQYNIIHSQLTIESIQQWKAYGGILICITLLHLLQAIVLISCKKSIPVYSAGISLFIYILYVYSYYSHIDTLIPSSIPRWMLNGEIIFYLGTFIMPTLIYSILLIVSYFTPPTKTHKLWKSFLGAFLIPIVLYLTALLIVPLWKNVDGDFAIHSVIILIIASTIIFLFFIIRGVYIITLRKSFFWKKNHLIWKIPITLILPVLGLLFNSGILMEQHSIKGIMGDFNSPWFYIITIVNSILLCLPNLTNRTYRYLLFVGRTITFSFTLYFFIVFLPFLPVSVIAIILIGVGFLLVTPLLLFVVHINELSNDYNFLLSQFTQRTIKISSFVAFLTIPMVVTLSFVKERQTLENVLEYLYTPNYTKEYHIDEASFQKTFNIIKTNRAGNNNSLMNSRIPYISTYFNWLVLDNLTLSKNKIDRINNIFLGKQPNKPRRHRNIQLNINHDVKITHSLVESKYDQKHHVWKSWIHLELTNQNKNTSLSEYATNIVLPNGSAINNYYLYIGEKKEMGILAEKRSAMWIYTQIVNEKRDPGILYYKTGNKVAFRVYPFSKDEVRHTGFELIHKEPVKIVMDNVEIHLGEEREQDSKIIETQDIAYIPSGQKSNLDKIQRQPYFHFLVDISKRNEDQKDAFIYRINKIMSKYPELSRASKITNVNSNLYSCNDYNDWKTFISKAESKGGFFLDRAIKSTLVKSYYKSDESYPIMVVVTDSLNHAVLDKDFSDLAITYPENKLFYLLKEDKILEPHSLITNPQKPCLQTSELSFYYPCLRYKCSNGRIAYLADDKSSSIVLKKDSISIDPKDIKEDDWISVMQIKGSWISQNLNPSQSNTEWLNLVKGSFISKTMTPVTSYMVVENEAQKAMLKKIQNQVLASNKSLDIGEEPQRMSEPSLWILSLLIGLILWIRQRIRIRKEPGKLK
ncbi:MSEP-CTERM sorting domain-containing protein [Halosquirtibacter xylanolyticus]|uniref:MSEP-CTERM sorting domain-containing protein n=1 Tax=Halosquirtibacter xylanolyticus TaxID=3374599 RepID=UPI00374A52FC|nr:MSEP-CTERM sorting domain-containing protein [Prolixibacteraceae bacterium]